MIRPARVHPSSLTNRKEEGSMNGNYQDLRIADLDRNHTQMASASTATAYYWRLIQRDPEWPLPVVFHDGRKYWLADGFQTIRAYEQAGRGRVRCHIRKGSKQEALIYGLEANDGRGLALSLADRRHALVLLTMYCVLSAKAIDLGQQPAHRALCGQAVTPRIPKQSTAGELPTHRRYRRCQSFLDRPLRKLSTSSTLQGSTLYRVPLPS